MISSDNKAWPLAPLFLGLLATLPLIGAQFGYGNQIEQLTIMARLQDPGFAPGDFYLDSAARFGPRIYYAWVLVILNAVLPLPVVIHGVAILCNFALGAVTYGAARRFLGIGALGAAIAAILAVTNGSFSLGFAGYLRFDSFQPANIAIPASLIGFYLLMIGRVWSAVVSFAIGMLMHPLIGVEIAGIAYGAIGLARLWGTKTRDWITTLRPLVISGLVFGLLIGLAWILPTLGHEAGETLSSEQFFTILAEFRAPHHYLGLTFPFPAWLACGIFAAVTLAILGVHMALQGAQRESIALTAAVLAVLALCAASILFVDIQNNRMFVTAQLFRMLMVLKWVGFLGLGWVLAEWIKRLGWTGWLLAAPVVLVTADGQPLAIVAVIGTWIGLMLGERLFGTLAGGRIWLVLKIGGLGILALASLWVTRRSAIEEQSARALAAFVLLGLLWMPKPAVPVRAMLGGGFTALLLGAVFLTRAEGLFGREGLKSQFVWADLTGDEMVIARRGAEVSPPDALWLVPPDLETFRMISRRAVLVDFTSIPFDDEALGVWYDRMQRLFGPLEGGGFTAAQAMKTRYREGLDWDAVVRDFGATHAVLYVETPWSGPVLAEHGNFKAVELLPR